MTTKCTGLMGRIFGHKWITYGQSASRDIAMIYVAFLVPLGERKEMPERGRICQRCGAVTGDKHGES